MEGRGEGGDEKGRGGERRGRGGGEEKWIDVMRKKLICK